MVEKVKLLEKEKVSSVLCIIKKNGNRQNARRWLIATIALLVLAFGLTITSMALTDSK